MCKVYTGYCGTSEIEHGLCACTVDNPLAKARGLSLHTGAQPMLYLPLIFISTTGIYNNQIMMTHMSESTDFRLRPVFARLRLRFLYEVLFSIFKSIRARMMILDLYLYLDYIIGMCQPSFDPDLYFMDQ